jgi:signal transduction histidine kinase
MKAINELLQMREKDHENFVHMATHELKSPVTVLKGYMQMIEAKLIAGKQGEEIQLLSKMDIQLEKLLKRINDLLDLAKVNGGAMQYNLANFDVNAALLHCIEEIKVANPDFLIEYEMMQQSVLVNGDKERIQQVVTNLLNNSIKYSAKEKYVKLTTQLIGKQVVVNIIDHGLGIPVDKQPFVFERFYRANQTQAPDKPGLGLGLFICNEIIKYHQGQMGMISQEGVGSTFWFKLPVQSTDGLA